MKYMRSLSNHPSGVGDTGLFVDLDTSSNNVKGRLRKTVACTALQAMSSLAHFGLGILVGCCDGSRYGCADLNLLRKHHGWIHARHYTFPSALSS